MPLRQGFGRLILVPKVILACNWSRD